MREIDELHGRRQWSRMQIFCVALFAAMFAGAYALEMVLLTLPAWLFLGLGGVAGVLARFDRARPSAPAPVLHATVALIGFAGALWSALEVFG